LEKEEEGSANSGNRLFQLLYQVLSLGDYLRFVKV